MLTVIGMVVCFLVLMVLVQQNKFNAGRPRRKTKLVSRFDEDLAWLKKMKFM